jgi:hypothetical protein
MAKPASRRLGAVPYQRPPLLLPNSLTRPYRRTLPRYTSNVIITFVNVQEDYQNLATEVIEVTIMLL